MFCKSNVRVIFKPVQLRFLLPGLVALLVSACGPNSSSEGYFRSGVGAKLPAADTKSSGELQHQYFNYLCQQANIGSGRECINGLTVPQSWTLITYQGMNDIDRRCDAYLEWLDDKKRSKTPLLSQISTIDNAATQIVGATIGAKNAVVALSVISQAFDLVTKSIENYHSRLLLEVDQSTINSIVLRARHRFREGFADRQIQVSSKPEAEYVLRSYLRICLPFAIESTINDNATLVSLGVSPSDAMYESLHQTPVMGAPKPFEGNTKVDVKPKRQKSVWAPGGWQNIAEKGVFIDLPRARKLQRSLCLTGNDLDGAYGKRTEAALRVFESIVKTNNWQDADWRNEKVSLSKADLNKLGQVSGCRTGAGNYLENHIIATLGASQERRLAQAIQNQRGLPPDAQTFIALRSEIGAIRRDLNLQNGPNAMFKNQITADLVAVLLPAPLPAPTR